MANVSLLNTLLGISQDTSGFGNIFRKSISPATAFGADSKLAKIFSSEQMRDEARAVQTGKQVISTTSANNLGDQLENTSDKYLEEIAENTSELKDLKSKTSGGQTPKKTDGDDILKDVRGEEPSITKEQGEKLVKAIEKMDVSFADYGAALAALAITESGKSLFKKTSEFATENPAMATGIGIGATAGAGALAANKMRTKLPAGTKLNSAGQLIDAKTGKFVTDDRKNKAPSKQVNKKIREKVQKRTVAKVATKFAAKLAVRGALATTGVGIFASGALLATDAAGYIFSEGKQKEATLISPGSTQEEKEEAIDWLITNAPERVGIPEDVPPENRYAFLEAQEVNPELTAEDFNKQVMAEQGGPSNEQIARLQEKVKAETSGFFNRESNDLEEAQEIIRNAGMEGQVVARKTDSGIQIERASSDAMIAQQQAAGPTIINAGGQTPPPAPPGDVIVTLPKTILSLNPSAQRFVAFRG